MVDLNNRSKNFQSDSPIADQGHAAHERLGQESHRAQVANILAASSNGFCRHFDRAV